MSFVLDALKRSEQDRNQGQVPSFSDQGSLMHLSQPKRHWWPYVLIIVLILNALVFIYLGVGKGGSESLTASGNAEVEAPAEMSSEAPTRPQTPETASLGRSLSEPVGMATLTQGGAETAALGSGTQAPEQTGRADSVAISASAENPNPDWEAKKQEALKLIAAARTSTSTSTSNTSIPEGVAVRIDPFKAPVAHSNQSVSAASAPGQQALEVIKPKRVPQGGALPFPSHPGSNKQAEIDAEFAESPVSKPVPEKRYTNVPFLTDMASEQPRIPRLTFNSHIYSDIPSARRVMINNIYLREGQEVSGLKVLEIGEQDIVFSQGQTLFKLPAMRDWDG